MSRLCTVAAAVSALCASAASAEPGGGWVAGGAGQRGTDFDVQGILNGSFLPSVIGQTMPADLAFDRSRSDRTSTVELSAGYDHELSNGLFVGIDGSLSTGGAAVTMASVVSDVTRNTYLPVTECPPPGIPVPCIFLREILHTAHEVQSLTIDIEETYGGSLGLRAGYSWGRARIWIGAGLAARGVDLAYDLPPLERTLDSARPSVVPTTSIVLPAESRHEKATLSGSSLSAGVEYDAGPASIVLTYARADYGDVDFFDTVRVSGLQVSAVSEAGTIAVKLAF
jgi:opacity protein-like surface antigen